MNSTRDSEKVMSVLHGRQIAAVATVGGREELRTRLMHCAVGQDFSFYLASMRNDPKTIQIIHHPGVSLLFHDPSDDLGQSNEVEVCGRVEKVADSDNRRDALAMLKGVSPVVKYMVESGNADALEVLKVVPRWIKHRNFAEITRGLPPTVIDFPERKTGAGDTALLARKLGIWWMELRPSFLLATLVPILLGGCVAWVRTGVVSWAWLLLSLLAGILLHMGTNMINDYFDHRSRNDETNRSFVRPFSGGSRMIQLGLLTPLEVLSAALICLSLGSAVGTYLAWVRGLWLMVFGLIGVVSAVFYSAPPITLANRGAGELVIGLNFGLLLTLGSYFVQTGRLDWEPTIVAIPIALLITAVVYINEFPDHDADKQVGKATLVVRLGLKRAVIGYVALLAAAYVILIAGVVAGLLSDYALLGLLSLPLAVFGVRTALVHYGRPFDLVPANASTVFAHLATGALIMAGYILKRAGLSGIVGVIPLAAVTALIILWLRRYIERQRLMFKGVGDSVRSSAPSGA